MLEGECLNEVEGPQGRRVDSHPFWATWWRRFCQETVMKLLPEIHQEDTFHVVGCVATVRQER